MSYTDKIRDRIRELGIEDEKVVIGYGSAQIKGDRYEMRLTENSGFKPDVTKYALKYLYDADMCLLWSLENQTPKVEIKTVKKTDIDFEDPHNVVKHIGSRGGELEVVRFFKSDEIKDVFENSKEEDLK